MTLHHDFLTRPIAHRGLHGPGVPENSIAAARAAIAAGYGIECDIQPDASGRPLVFHDYDLRRLTGATGVIAAQEAAAVDALRLRAAGEAIPTLQALLDEVAGRVPLLVEIKDQDGTLGPAMGDLPARVAATLAGYDGPVAVMSFNPDAVVQFREAGGTAPVGLTTCAFPAEDWRGVPAERRAHLAALGDLDRVGASFISHDRTDLANPAVIRARAAGLPVLCWTVRSATEEAEARAVAQNITFEGYLP